MRRVKGDRTCCYLVSAIDAKGLRAIKEDPGASVETAGSPSRFGGGVFFPSEAEVADGQGENGWLGRCGSYVVSAPFHSPSKGTCNICCPPGTMCGLRAQDKSSTRPGQLFLGEEWPRGRPCLFRTAEEEVKSSLLLCLQLLRKAYKARINPAFQEKAFPGHRSARHL